MAWTDKIFAYCERAGDPAFWADGLDILEGLVAEAEALAAATGH